LSKNKRYKNPKIFWRYQYIEGCKDVTKDDVIITKPDTYNRWLLTAYIKIHKTAMPEYNWVPGKFVIVDIAHIHQKSCINSYVPSTINNFCCEFPSIKDANLGYGNRNFFGDTPNEVMKQVEEVFEKTIFLFQNCKNN
jgi:hypothetical protein